MLFLHARLRWFIVLDYLYGEISVFQGNWQNERGNIFWVECNKGILAKLSFEYVAKLSFEYLAKLSFEYLAKLSFEYLYLMSWCWSVQWTHALCELWNQGITTFCSSVVFHFAL